MVTAIRASIIFWFSCCFKISSKESGTGYISIWLYQSGKSTSNIQSPWQNWGGWTLEFGELHAREVGLGTLSMRQQLEGEGLGT